MSLAESKAAEHRTSGGRTRFLDKAETEETFELAAELPLTLVTDAVSGDARAESFMHHQHARFVEPNGLQVLQRGVRGDGLEILMEGRLAHSGGISKFLDGEISRVIRVDTLQGAIDLSKATVKRGGGAECPALPTAQDPVDNFANDLRTENASVSGIVHSFQQADNSVSQDSIQGRGKILSVSRRFRSDVARRVS